MKILNNLLITTKFAVKIDKKYSRREKDRLCKKGHKNHEK